MKNAQPMLAMNSLEKLKDEILIREGARIKNDYMKKLGIKALQFGISSLVIGTMLELFSENSILSTYLFIWTGSMTGAWFSFGVRKMDFKFEDLHIVETDRLNPTLRLIFIGMTAIFFSMFLKIGVIEVKMGSFSTLDLGKSIESAFILGALCGMLENKLALDLYGKASDIMNLS